MPYSVWCSVDGCKFEEEAVWSLDRVFDLQDVHADHLGDHHVLEFDRVAVVNEGV